ncbi:MAG: phage head morphogenesis protein [Clostridiales bacterium]|nr:phage head morphogenesis protein [Clostridiales bacterium]
MCRMCDGLIKAIDRYLAKADEDLANELADEGRAVPKDSVSMVNEMEDGIAAALAAQTDYFIKKIKAQKSVEALMKVFEEIKANDVYCDEIAAVANEALKKYIPKMVVSYTKTVDAGIKITAVSKRTTAWVESWSQELADLMKLNSHTEIESILKTALENGDSIATVTQTIMDSGIRDERYKARRAALTEMFRAQNISKYEAALQNPCVIGRKWRHLGIGNPRPNHVAMDGQTVAKDEPFTLIGADGSVYYPYYPIDPLLPAGEAINCHCVADNVIDSDILGLSAEERQQMRDEAIAQLDEEWEKEVDAKYRALVGLTTDEEQYIIKWDESLHPRDENGRFTESDKSLDNSDESDLIETEEINLQNQLSYTYHGENSFIPNETVINNVHTIAGKGSNTSLRIAKKLSAKYGGKVSDWSKKVGKIESDKYIFDVHWYELNGKQYRMKLKNRSAKK